MKRINLLVPINALSYGIAAKNIALALDKIADVSIIPIDYHPTSELFSNEGEFDSIVRMVNKGTMFDLNAPCIKIFHQNKMDTFVGRSTHIGFPFFELDTFSDVEKHHLSTLDKVVVASSWAKDVCTNAGITNVHVAPLGVDTSVFSPSKLPSTNDTIVFLNIGKFEKRKGHDFLVRCFNKAFDNGERVALMLMPTNIFLKQDEKTYWESVCSGPRVFRLPRLTSPHEVAKIIKTAHCGVFPSRAEGWNLPLLETMACGRQVIATNYSAHTEYCNQDNCRLISIDEVEPAIDHKWFFGQGNWAKFGPNQEEQLIHHMRDFYKNVKDNQNGVLTASKYSWTNTAEKMEIIC